MEIAVNKHSQAWRFFWASTTYPRISLCLSICLILIFARFLPTLVKDTRSDAFMPVDHPALLLSKKARETFGLGDPMAIAIINTGPEGVFNPHTLQLLDWLTSELESIDNLDPEGIRSLATENNIIGTTEGMEVEPFFETLPTTAADAAAIKAAAMAFPLYVGTLVAEDGSGTIIIAEQLDVDQAQATYQALMALASRADLNSDEHIHIAGEGALMGYFGTYIDADASRILPLSATVIIALCCVAFGTLRGALIPSFVVLATVSSAVGLMAALGVSFFIITNALPVVLIGIAVADSIHILTEYYEAAAQHPTDSPRELVATTMSRIWRPITLTSLTTTAGFFGLSIASMMPPMKYFGLFALFGVGIAWLYSMFIVPALLSLLKPQASRAYHKAIIDSTEPEPSSDQLTSDVKREQLDGFARIVCWLGKLTLGHPRSFLLLGVLTVTAGIHGGLKIEMDESLIQAFQQDEPIIIANEAVNKAFDGTYFLDVMVETPNSEDLFKPENLHKIEALQTHMEGHPFVKGSTSVVDYLKQMNRAMHADAPEAYRLPDSVELSAQYFLLYSVTADPTDFHDIIDYDYRVANIRISLEKENYKTIAPVIEYLNDYLHNTFNGPQISAQPTGRANINYEWMQRLSDGHLLGLSVTLALVFMMATLSFRSLTAGLFCLAPIATTIFGVYAYMGYAGVALSVSSSMFAAIAIGLGVDFSIHTVERLQVLITRADVVTDQTLMALFPSTGRALLFNFLTLASGFGILIFSKVVILQEFGICVSLAITMSFLASIILLPAMAKTFQPQFLGYPDNK
ncbi:MAG: MMPL family transporter [Gammaproteobacteria bacterium]|nr:MMPL family transporter [Gammaproteobacteria bacterium]MBQ0839848.1 MMPL family transporter [Gammaproteobacteria bacterium]